jgi:hypothetical protein
MVNSIIATKGLNEFAKSNDIVSVWILIYSWFKGIIEINNVKNKKQILSKLEELWELF